MAHGLAEHPRSPEPHVLVQCTIYTSAHSSSDDVAGAVTPVLQGRKLRSKGTLASDHTKTNAGGAAQTPTPGYMRSHRRSCGSAWRASRHPRRRHRLPGSSQSGHGTQGLTRLHCLTWNCCQSHRQKQTRPGLVSASQWGWVAGHREEAKNSFLLTEQIMWFTWHRTMPVITTHYEYKTLLGCGNGSRTTLTGSAGLSF